MEVSSRLSQGGGAALTGLVMRPAVSMTPDCGMEPSDCLPQGRGRQDGQP